MRREYSSARPPSRRRNRRQRRTEKCSSPCGHGAEAVVARRIVDGELIFGSRLQAGQFTAMHLELRHVGKGLGRDPRGQFLPALEHAVVDLRLRLIRTDPLNHHRGRRILPPRQEQRRRLTGNVLRELRDILGIGLRVVGIG